MGSSGVSLTAATPTNSAYSDAAAVGTAANAARADHVHGREAYGRTSLVDLTAYGGTSTAGTAINAAMAALPSTGGTILIPGGTWTIDTAVLIAKNGVILQGTGPASTILQFNGGTVTTAIKMTDTTQRYFHMRDLRIDQTGTSGTGTAIDGSYFVNSTFKNLRIGSGGAVNKGIYFNANGSYYNRVSDCRVSVAGSGSVGIGFANVSNDNAVDNVKVLGDASTTAYYLNAQSLTFDRCTVETTVLYGFDVASAGNGCTITEPYVEGVQNGLRVANTVEALTVLGGSIIDSTTANIVDNGAVSLKLINVWMGNSTYDPVTYSKNNKGQIARRWINPFHTGIGSASASFTAGRVVVALFELVEDCVIDGITYVVGGSSAGNVTVGVYGPIGTEETAAGAAVLVQSASTAQSASINTDQFISLTATYARAGRYYVALEGDNTGGSYMRQANQIQVTGWGQQYDRAGGYGTLTDPAPSMTGTGNNIPCIRVRCTSFSTF